MSSFQVMKDKINNVMRIIKLMLMESKTSPINEKSILMHLKTELRLEIVNFYISYNILLNQSKSNKLLKEALL